MRSTVLLLLTVTVASFYIVSLFFVQFYIHLSLDDAPSGERSLTVDVSNDVRSSSSHANLPEALFSIISGNVFRPRNGADDATNASGLTDSDICPDSRGVTSPTVGAERRRNQRLRRLPFEDHLHPIQPECVDLPLTAEAGTTSTSEDEFQPIPEGFLYSAYFDDRNEKEPAIRIIALLKKLLRKSDVRSGLYCHVPRVAEVRGSASSSSFQFQNSSAFLVSVPVTFYEMCENHGKDFGGWILSCKLPATASPPPCSVYVSTEEFLLSPLEPDVVRLTVLRTRSDQKSVDADISVSSDERFGVCIPPLFGRITAQILADFVELTQILGADHLFFYVPQPLPAEIRLLLKRYVRLGVVTAVPWPLPVSENAIWYYGQLLSINDCLYRTMHAFKYVAFNDLDEFVVPHVHSDWTELLAALRMLRPPETEHSPAVHCGYSFKSAFFDPLTGSGTATGNRVDYELESNVRTKSFSRIRNKLIVLPVLNFELGIHHISRPLNVGSCSVVKVEPEVAILHHYRECTTSFDGKMNCHSVCQDDSMAPFLSVLRRKKLNGT